MTKTRIIIAIISVLCISQPVAHANDDSGPPTVVVRSDNKIAEPTGKIIAVPNPSDPRNTSLKKYYSNIERGCEEGQPCESDFYIVNDPERGYVRLELNESVTVKRQDPQQSGGQQGDNNMVFDYSKTNIIIEGDSAYGSEPDMGAAY